jgi:hypothetical protein
MVVEYPCLRSVGAGGHTKETTNMPRQLLTPEQRSALLEQAMQPYIKKGWILQSKTEGMVQLLKPAKQYGCVMRILLALILLFFPRYDKLVTITVDPYGKVSKNERRAN